MLVESQPGLASGVVGPVLVPAPSAARYAWVNNPSEANIVGGDGLPLRTDDWPLESAGRGYGR